MSLLPIISPEREKELIEKISNSIVKSGYEDLAILTLSMFEPFAYIWLQSLTMIYGVYTLFIPNTGSTIMEIVALLQKRENYERLIERLSELKAEKEDLKRKERSRTGKKMTILEKIAEFFGVH